MWPCPSRRFSRVVIDILIEWGGLSKKKEVIKIHLKVKTTARLKKSFKQGHCILDNPFLCGYNSDLVTNIPPILPVTMTFNLWPWKWCGYNSDLVTNIPQILPLTLTYKLWPWMWYGYNLNSDLVTNIPHILSLTLTFTLWPWMQCRYISYLVTNYPLW